MGWQDWNLASTHNLLVHLTLTSMIWGFFCSTGQLQWGDTPNDESGIIQYASLAYQQYDLTKSNRIWLTLIAVLNKIIEHHGGGNNFRLPHLKKGALDIAGQLPNSLTVTAAALEYLDGHN